MNTATRRTTARKAMRVATVFTGAAAAAVAFAPGAVAAPAHAVARAAPDSQPPGPIVYFGNIQSKGCTNNTWLHVAYTVFASIFVFKRCKQFGNAGDMVPKSNPLLMSAQCGGNNVGFIDYSNNGIQSQLLRFRQGSTYRTFASDLQVSQVSISHWSGTKQCRWPRS